MVRLSRRVNAGFHFVGVVEVVGMVEVTGQPGFGRVWRPAIA